MEDRKRRIVSKCLLTLLVTTQLSPLLSYLPAMAETTTTTTTDSSGDTDITQTVVCTCEACEKVYEEVKAIRDDLDSYVPAVTVIRSINNTISNCYYKPKLEEIPLLKEKIIDEYQFVNAYTGSFDLDRTDSYKPLDTQTRALEILGYDFLLSAESYEREAETPYAVTRVTGDVTRGIAIMDIYKALGLAQYAVTVYQESDDTLTLENSPVAKGLPSFVKDLDVTRGKTDVFVTRTNAELYYTKATKDLSISKSGASNVITYGDFIILLARMMHYYGEPVISEAETNLLLQVYGAEIPTYLSEQERDAYLYLKARGVLNVDIEAEGGYTKAVQLETMIDILMCVQDEDSRTDYKQIQVIRDIGEELINAGYFPRDVYMAVGDEAIEVSNEVYDYSEATAYDYYIQVTDKTKFVDADGNATEYINVPSVPTDSACVELDGSKYLGTVTMDDGTVYYHLQINIMSINSTYMKKTTKVYGKVGYIKVDTSADIDYPSCIWLPQGGGVYTISSGPNKSNVIVMKRREFQDDEFDGAVCIERVQTSESASENTDVGTLLAGIKSIGNFLFGSPIIAHAATSYIETYQQYSTNGTTVTFTLYNADTISSYDGSIINLAIEKSDNKWDVTLPAVFKDVFLASIERAVSDDTTAYPAIASMSGDVLLKYNDLVDAGVFYNDDGEIPTPEDYNKQILVLTSTYGQIVLNNETREVVVGNTIYRLKNDGTPLFKYVVEDNESVLWVDFRAAYGWSANIVDTVITGTGSSYTVNVQVLGESNRVGLINSAIVKAPDSFKTYALTETMQVIPVKALDDESPKAIMSSTYSLANWVIFQGINRSSGLLQDYAFIFYREEAFVSTKAPDDIHMMTDILGYSVEVDGWVCRVVKLSRNPTTKVGQFTYTEDFGYVYNLPKWSKFTMEKYISSEYLLPISYSGDNIINANVNYFNGYAYGSRPTNNNTEGIDIKGNSTTGNIPATPIVMSAAPAGVSSFYGGVKRKYYSAGSNILALTQNQATNANVYYYGTTRCVVAGESGSQIKLRVEFTGIKPWIKVWSVNSNQKFYKVKAFTSGSTTAGVLTVAYRWVMYDDILISNISTIEDVEESSLIVVVDGEQKDEYSGDQEFTVKYFINLIDTSASWVVAFAFKVLPLIGICAITILMGLSTISQMRIVRLLCEKLVDPVKILTFGVMTVEELYFNKAFLRLMLGYIGFALVMDGNLLRIIQWLLEFYDAAVVIMRQM